MAQPKFFRDPLHLQIRFDQPQDVGDGSSSAELLGIIDSPEFQRLRFVRQNGLANLVFHGAEHSRFTHSVGVMHVARTMYERICRNMSEAEESDLKLNIQIAALVHDVGHGPFSHTMEEILNEHKIEFHHETMTRRFILEEDGSSISTALRRIDKRLPDLVAAFFDKKLRPDEHWSYRLISSQMDADRLDYVQRDALFAGLRGHGFDIERVFDLLYHQDNSIAIHRGAIEAVESYLVTIDQLYRAIYYHHTVRAATQILLSLFRRAVDLFTSGDSSIFPSHGGRPHPMAQLITDGDRIALSDYLRLTDACIWSLIDQWRLHSDSILMDLSDRVINRRLLKTINIDMADFSSSQKLIERARDLTRDKFGPDNEKYYFMIDQPTRTSYKGYDWRPNTPTESIWLIGGGKEANPLEDEADNAIVAAFKTKKQFPRLIVAAEIRDALSTS